MNNILLISSSIILSVLLFLLLLVLKRINTLISAYSGKDDKYLAELSKKNHDEILYNFAQYRKDLREVSAENRGEINKILKDLQDTLLKRISENVNFQNNRLDSFSNILERQLKSIQDNNTSQLTEIRKTVDEKLQTTLEKRLGESFKQVSERLELVHKGLGDMQTLASGVGDLKKVLSNVKTRGILGEYQLGNILEQILSPGQYAKNVATKKGSQANVEYAIRLPGKNSDEEVWIPVDSKYPLENYNKLMDAYEEGEQSKIDTSQKHMLKTIELFAKEISDKYIDPPYTTDFGIMFLPVEGLYAEVLRHTGLFEKLQRDYHITVTGPTTLSALLNSLHMGYRTLAIQRRSSEVWKVLSAVKTEFGNFSEQLSRVHKQLNTATNSLEVLRNTRTNVMEKKLQSLETMDSMKAKELLSLPMEED